MNKADQLTPEQRKRVAEAATGNSYMIVTAGPNGGGMPLIAEEINPDDPGALWKPHKKSDQWKALVTWLLNNCREHGDLTDLMSTVDAILEGADSAEAMAYEILEAQKEYGIIIRYSNMPRNLRRNY